VEDDADIRYLASKKLRAAGYTIIDAVDGNDAIGKMLDHPQCRQMVTDYVMPGFGGDYWVRFLERFCADWTIAVVSSEDIDAGPFVYLPKPVDYGNLVSLFVRGRK
jgi:CheY-like chemotaxis protein